MVHASTTLPGLMVDPAFADHRLAAIYDDIERARPDLDLYEALITKLGASRVLDVGCGTGTLACRLAARGLTVVGIDPARASLDIARAKPGAETVTWLEGTATDLPPLEVDVATMTGNVAQVFVGDDDWVETLAAIRDALRDGGHLVVETRDPEFRAWERWRDQPSETVTTSAGPVECSIEVTAVELPLVSFRWTYRFHDTGQVLTSNSTLRFRSRQEMDRALTATGFDVVEVRDAPDRPGRELVFVARAVPA